MSALIISPESDRMRRQSRPRAAGRTRVLRIGAVLGLVWALGWGWRVAPVYKSARQARAMVQALEHEEGDTDVASASPAVAVQHDTTSPTPQSSARSREDDDVSALVRWHDLLREHRLRDWQGRSVPTSTPAGAVETGRGWGALWRLEGPASFEQGVALLQAMTRRFPHLLLLQVQVQVVGQGQPGISHELLQWRLELHWSTPLSTVVQHWPPGGVLDLDDVTDPFALERLQAVTTPHQIAAPHDPADHVLPRAPLQDIRLIGVMGAEQDRLALVVWATPPDRASHMHGVRAALTPQRVRVGQRLGLERTRVAAIEAGAVVLQGTHTSGGGQQRDRRQVLALAASTAEPASDGGRRP